MYRVMLVVWQYVKLGQYTTCLDLLGLLGFWLTGQSKWADWLNLSTQPNCQTTRDTLYTEGKITCSWYARRAFFVKSYRVVLGYVLGWLQKSLIPAVVIFVTSFVSYSIR